MKYILLFCILLGGCKLTPSKEPTRTHLSPAPPPMVSKHIRPGVGRDYIGAQSYVEQLMLYRQYIDNHIQYIAASYDIALPSKECTLAPPGPIIPPAVPTLTGDHNKDLALLMEYVERLYENDKEHNRALVQFTKHYMENCKE